MASINLDGPGAYPETPLNEEPAIQTQTQHNTLQHRGEPSTSHTSNIPTFAHENPTQQAQFNEATPRSLGNDLKTGIPADDLPSSRERGDDKPGFMTGAYSRVGTQPSAPAQSDNYIYDDKSASKPPFGEDKGLLNPATDLAAKTPANTPAENTAINSIKKTLGGSNEGDHNKIQSGLRGSSNTANSEPYWGDIPFGTGVYNGVTGHGSDESTAQQQKSLHDQYDTATSTGVYNGVTGHGSDESTAQQQKSLHDQHDTATNTGISSTGISNTGIYNGVIGHGSDESTTQQQDPLHDQYDTATNTGIDNGVTGHGSERSTSPWLSKHEENTTTDELSHQQRAFPLVNNDNETVAATKPTRADEHKRDSRFKEGFATAGAAAAGGYATHEYLDKHNDREARATDDNLTGHSSNRLNESKPNALAQPSHNNGEEIVSKYDGKEQTLPHRPFVAAPVHDKTQQKALERQPLNAENDNRHQEKDDSHLGKYGATAAVVGAGAYGANKFANRDSSKERSPVPENTVSREATREPISANAQSLDTKIDNTQRQNESSNLGERGIAAAAAGVGAYSVNKHANRDATQGQSSLPETQTSQSTTAESINNGAQLSGANNRVQPHHDMLSDGTPSGVANTSVHQPEYSSLSGTTQNEQRTVPSDGNAAAETQSIGRSSTDSSHGGKYNVLSSGTPSGINLEQMRAEKEHRREQQPQQPHLNRYLSNSPSSSAPSQSLAAGVRNTTTTAVGNTAEDPARQTTKGVPEQVPGAGNEMSTGSAFTSGRKMTHTCTSCGAENDISEHMMI